MKAIVAGDDPGLLGVKDMSNVTSEVRELCSTSSNNSSTSSVTPNTSQVVAPPKQPAMQQTAVVSPEVEKAPPPNVVSKIMYISLVKERG